MDAKRGRDDSSSEDGSSTLGGDSEAENGGDGDMDVETALSLVSKHYTRNVSCRECPAADCCAGLKILRMVPVHVLNLHDLQPSWLKSKFGTRLLLGWPCCARCAEESGRESGSRQSGKGVLFVREPATQR